MPSLNFEMDKRGPCTCMETLLGSGHRTRKISQLLLTVGERFRRLDLPMYVMLSDYYRYNDFEFRYFWAERDGEPMLVIDF